MDGYQVGAFARPWTEFTWEEFLSGVAGAGYEYMGFMRHPDAELLPGTGPDKIAWIRESLQRHGLTPTSEISLHHTSRCPLHEGAEAAVQEACAVIDVMEAVGVPYYISCGTPEESLNETLLTVLREAAAYGEDRGVTVTLKPHGGIGATCSDLVRVVELVDHPNFAIYYDPGNILYFTARDPLENLEDVTPHVVAVVIKDQTGGVGGPVTIEPGTGDVDFEGMFEILRDGGFTGGPVMVECLGGGNLADTNMRAARVRERVERWLAG